MLYDPALHEPLTGTAWDERRVQDAIRRIVAQADSAYDPDALWPAHEWDGWQAALPLKNLYVGAGGMAWGLDALRRRGAAETALEPADVAARALDAFRREPDFIQEEKDRPKRMSALLVGETGLLLVAWRLRSSNELADALLARVHENLGNDTNELMWGVPGTLLAARAMLEWTGEERWADAVRESEADVREARDEDGLWTQRLWGSTFRSLSPPHGLVGNVAALGEVGDAAEILRERAVRENGRTNWLDDDGRLQWCVGAPGIVAHATAYLDDDLVLGAAQLIWDAGPKNDEKGAGICHGTAANGYALLKTFERTGDERWLERARAFAVHALEQAERLPPRYSLFTGGIGAALFAADCLDAEARFPLVDGF